MHSKMVLDVLGERMHLKRKIAATDGVQKVEPNGKLVAEARMHLVAEQRAGLSKYEVQRWNLKADSPQPEHKAVFFGHTIEAPAEIQCAPVQIDRRASCRERA